MERVRVKVEDGDGAGYAYGKLDKRGYVVVTIMVDDVPRAVVLVTNEKVAVLQAGVGEEE